MPTCSYSEPRWKFIERTVAVLEHMLAAGASVQHDQQVKELATGTLRQCDVVIRYGTPPRQTLAAIVEVQDRSKKVGIQQFEEWCAKREKLGAQRLICVSQQGFTEDVKKDAVRFGDTVCLMTLIEPESPSPFIATTEIMFNANIVQTRDAQVTFKDKVPSTSITCDDKIFESPAGGDKVAMFSLAEKALRSGAAKDVQKQPLEARRYQLKYRVEFGAAGQPLLLKLGDETYPVWGAHFVDVIEEIHQLLARTPLAYEERNIDGALAWVLFGTGTYNGKEFYTQQPFVKLADGSVQPGPPTISKLSGCSMVSFFTEMLIPTLPTAPFQSSPAEAKPKT